MGNSAVPQISTGPRVLGVHAPVGRIDVVRAPAGDHACSELLHTEPARTIEPLERHHSIDGVRHIRRRAEPGVVVEVGGDRHRRWVAARGIAGQADLYMLHFADAAVANQLAGAVELLP